ncbi:hypothetical protein [Hydrococcus rivularis]|nr:hypothetical protein [Hydrococcus rivularis]
MSQDCHCDRTENVKQTWQYEYVLRESNTKKAIARRIGYDKK